MSANTLAAGPQETLATFALILSLAVTASVSLSACTGVGTTESDTSGGQAGPPSREIQFLMTPAPKTGMFVVGPAFYVSAPERLSGSYSVTVYSLDCGPGDDMQESLAHLSLFPAGSNGFGQELYRFGNGQGPTDLPSGDYVVAYNNPPSTYSCWFDVGLTPR